MCSRSFNLKTGDFHSLHSNREGMLSGLSCLRSTSLLRNSCPMVHTSVFNYFLIPRFSWSNFISHLHFSSADGTRNSFHHVRNAVRMRTVYCGGCTGSLFIEYGLKRFLFSNHPFCRFIYYLLPLHPSSSGIRLDSSLPRDRNIVFRVFRCCESAGSTSCQYTSVQLSKIILITNVLQTCPFTNSLQYSDDLRYELYRAKTT